MKCQLFWSVDRPRSCATGDHALVRMPRKLTVSYGPTEMLYIGASPGGLPASEASPSRHAESPPASPRWVRTYGRPGSAAARFDIHPLRQCQQEQTLSYWHCGSVNKNRLSLTDTAAVSTRTDSLIDTGSVNSLCRQVGLRLGDIRR